MRAPITDPSWGTGVDRKPQSIIAEPETRAGEPAVKPNLALVVVWLVVVLGVMWAAMPIAFITAVALYGWEQPGLIGVDDGLALPIIIGTAVYVVTSLLPIAAGLMAFPRRKAAMTVIGLLTPAAGLGAAWLFYVVLR